MLHYVMSSATDSKSGSRVTQGTITLPSTTKKIVGVFVSVGGVLTTAQGTSGLCEFEADNIQLKPCQIPVPDMSLVTSGAASVVPRVWPLDADAKGSTTISSYVTLDMANTGAIYCRTGVAYQD